MNWTQLVFDLIDLRSFSNLWYWIALAVTWSTASHWVLGVPYDMVLRARRHGGQAETDLEDIVRINITRLLYIAREAGLILVTLGTFTLTTLAIARSRSKVRPRCFGCSSKGMVGMRSAMRAPSADRRSELRRHHLVQQVHRL